MSILINQPRPEPTKEQKLAQIASRIKGSISSTYQTLTNLQKQGINSVWNHPTLTPQEIVDALGVDAVKIFQYHGKLTSLIEEIAQAEGVTPDVLYPKNAFTVNPTTGKITITDQPYQKL
jgi:hypothetical protein